MPIKLVLTMRVTGEASPVHQSGDWVLLAHGHPPARIQLPALTSVHPDSAAQWGQGPHTTSPDQDSPLTLKRGPWCFVVAPVT